MNSSPLSHLTQSSRGLAVPVAPPCLPSSPTQSRRCALRARADGAPQNQPISDKSMWSATHRPCRNVGDAAARNLTTGSNQLEPGRPSKVRYSSKYHSAMSRTSGVHGELLKPASFLL